ncbi:MAG: hypothetical protein IPG88_26395 [Gemmatimonadetes bacterium]|nr:hypothetical protein [Gemmatimonadota bacterium]
MRRALTPAEQYARGRNLGVRQDEFFRERAVRGIHSDRDVVASVMLTELLNAGLEVAPTATGVRLIRTAAPGNDAHPEFASDLFALGYTDHFAPLLREALLPHPCLICGAARVPLEGMRCDRCAET